MRWETGFIEPEPSTVRGLASRILREAGDATPVDDLEWVRSGSSSLVGLSPLTAVRVARGPSQVPDLLRGQRLVDALPDLPFAVPRSRTAPLTQDGVTGIGAERMVGRPRPPGPADPGVLRALLEAVHGIPVGPVAHLLAPPKAFCGGENWQQVLREIALPCLPIVVREPCRRIVDELARQPVPARRVNHGDLAGSNLLWSEGTIVAVLDWDLASHEDPAEDLASLAGWFGWDLARSLADEETVGRAEVFSRTFPLMSVAFALLQGRPASEVERAVQRVVDRIEAAPGTH